MRASSYSYRVGADDSKNTGGRQAFGLNPANYAVLPLSGLQTLSKIPVQKEIAS
jgi:hypothetical protein